MKSLIITYLENVTALMKTQDADKFYNWQLKNGQLFKNRDKRREKQLMAKGFAHKQKQCYYNSQMAILNLGVNTVAKYYEGWYIPKKIPIPMEHGFLVENGKVIDLTAKGDVREYFGVEIPTKFILQKINETKMATALIFYYWDVVYAKQRRTQTK